MAASLTVEDGLMRERVAAGGSDTIRRAWVHGFLFNACSPFLADPGIQGIFRAWRRVRESAE